jgi:hypothetical protein
MGLSFFLCRLPECLDDSEVCAAGCVEDSIERLIWLISKVLDKAEDFIGREWVAIGSYVTLIVREVALCGPVVTYG